MEDGAAYFRAMYLEHCADCVAAGIAPPTPEEWVELIDQVIREAPERR